jgi:hypothetical protein
MGNKFIKWLLSTFRNGSDIASARKITAFWMVVILTTPIEYTWLVWATKHNEFSMLLAVITANLSFAGSCLLLTTWQNVKQGNGKESSDDNSADNNTLKDEAKP